MDDIRMTYEWRDTSPQDGQCHHCLGPGTLIGQSGGAHTIAVALPALQAWRARRAMLQRELADASGVSLRTITRLEVGGRAGLDTVRNLAEALEVTPFQLMGPP